jgi:molecular chaperone DnaK (HSP70)
VIADDLGIRAIPIIVAYRNTNNTAEIITGTSALQQQYKNATNTFDDLRTLLCGDKTMVFVPALDKEIPG